MSVGAPTLARPQRWDVPFGDMSDADVEALPEHAAQEPGGALEASLGFLARGRVSQQGEKHLGVREIGGHLDVGEREHADAWILQFPADDVGKFASNLIGDAALALEVGHE